jgi:hypothetical protein
MRGGVACVLLLVTGCELVIGDEDRVVESDGGDAGDADVADAVPDADARATLDVVVHEVEAASEAATPTCAGPLTTCDAQAMACAATCDQTALTCTTQCMPRGSPPPDPPGQCMMQCASTDTTCKKDCLTACSTCVASSPCPQTSACAMSAL